MSSSVRIELNSDGVKELLHDPGIIQQMETLAGEQIASNGDDQKYEQTTVNGKNRAYVTVKGIGYKTINHNKKNGNKWG